MLIRQDRAKDDPALLSYPWWYRLIDAERAAFQENQFNVIAQTTMPGVAVGASEDSKGPSIYSENVAFQYNISDTDYWRAIARLEFILQRLRSYLAVAAARPVPLRYAFVGDRIERGGEYAVSPFSHRQVPGSNGPYLSMDTLWQTIRTVVAKAPSIDGFMERIPEGSALDRALTHAGNALWVVDDLDAYLHCWRAIEAAFGIEVDLLLSQGKGAVPTGRNPFESAVRERIQWGRRGTEASKDVSQAARIGYTVCERLGYDLSEDIEEIVSARRAVAHGDVSLEEFRLVESKLFRMIGLSHRVVCSALLGGFADAKGVVETLPNSSIPTAQVELEDDPAMTERIHQHLREEYEKRHRRSV